MKHVVATGQLYVDDDGDTFEVVKITKTKLTLESADGERFISTPEDFIDDLESGQFEPLNDDDISSS